MAYLPLDNTTVDIDLTRGFRRSLPRWCGAAFDRMSKRSWLRPQNPFNQQAVKDLAATTSPPAGVVSGAASDLKLNLRKAFDNPMAKIKSFENALPMPRRGRPAGVNQLRNCWSSRKKQGPGAGQAHHRTSLRQRSRSRGLLGRVLNVTPVNPCPLHILPEIAEFGLRAT